MTNQRRRRDAASPARGNQTATPPPADVAGAAADLSQAVACHQRGDTAAARDLYRQVLAAAPDNVDANNLLGVLLHQTGDLDAAASYAERAVTLYPPSPELHYNLGNIRRDQHRLDDAAACFRKARDLDPDYFEAIYNLAIILQHLGHTAEAIAHLERALQLQPDVPIGHCLLADLHLARGDYPTAIAAYTNAVDLAPDFAEAHNNLAVALRHTGDDATARRHLEQAIAAKPQYVDAHINLALLCQAPGTGNPDTAAAIRHFIAARDHAPADPRPHLGLAALNHNLGRFDDALAAYDVGLAAVPDDPALLNNLGSLYRDLGRAGDAIAAYRAALTANPDLAAARLNLAHVARDQNDPRTAIDHYRAVLDTEHADEAYTGLAAALAKTAVVAFDPVLHGLTAACFASDVVCHRDIASIAGALVCLRLGPNWTPDEASVAALADDPVAMGLLERTVNVDPGLEHVLTTVRRYLFDLADPASPDPSPAALRVMAALAIQGHNNAYVFATTPDEDAAVTVRGNTLRAGDHVPSVAQVRSVAQILSVAMYRPLPEVDLPDEPARWWRRFIDHAIAAPAAEQALAPAIPTLGRAPDLASPEVSGRDEADPYPRWQSLRANPAPPVARRIALINPAVAVDAATDLRDILIAGGGTGQQAIQVARANPRAQVLATDVSRRSLAYAARMAGLYGVDNIRFAQADILDLDAVDRRFPIIECVGVLHHMADPAVGLATLCDRLLPGGFIRLGLYSKTARGHVIAARQLTRAVQPTPANIRALRQQLLAETDRPPAHPTRVGDFYDLGGCRDLLFHGQEHNYTLPDLAALIADAGLEFIGFDFEDPAIPQAFRQQHQTRGALTDLDAWADFEAARPATFIGMYQFWCRKPG